MLEMRSICKKLGAAQLADISLTIDDGEYFVLLGPSGVGKTVLIEIIAGLLRPDAGAIFRDGADITFQPPEARGFAVVYQDYALFGHLSVAKNIAYGPAAAGAEAQTIRKRVAALSEMLGIEKLMQRRPGTLSGGEQQRVALARALAVEPRLLLLDEPLSSLDVNTRLRLRKELKRINRELNIPIFHVTHDPTEAMALGDRVGVMLEQKLRQVAGPEELFRRPSDPAVAEFLGMKNVLAVSEVKGDICIAHGEEIHVSSADETVRHIWIGPEEILLSAEAFGSSARNQFACTVAEWDNRDSLFAVHLKCGELGLTSLITYASFKDLQIEAGKKLYATFKSSAIHCF